MVKRNISKLSRHDSDWVYYAAQCTCCAEHQHEIYMELDEHSLFFTTFYYPVHLCYWHTNILRRIKIAFKVLMGWDTETTGDFVFDKESMRDYIDALEEGYQKLLIIEKEKAKKNE